MAAAVAILSPFESINSVFESWIETLNAQQSVSTVKEQLVLNPDHAELIAGELIRHGITIGHSVEGALEKMKALQIKKDSVELSILMTELPQQWEIYRINVQQNAQAYFETHRHIVPDFMREYFRRVSFVDLWNEVWTKYVGVPSSRELKLIDEVRTYLLQLSKPTAAQRALETKAVIRANKPELQFPFTAVDLKNLASMMKRDTTDKAETYTKQLATLRDSVIDMRKGDTELRRSLTKTESLVRLLNDNNNAWSSNQVRESADDDQLAAQLARAIETIKTVCSTVPNIAEADRFFDRLEKKKADTNRELTDFVKSSSFKLKYQTYLKAHVDYQRAEWILGLIPIIEEALVAVGIEERDVSNAIRKEVNILKETINHDYTYTLSTAMKDAKAIFVSTQEQAFRIGLTLDSISLLLLMIDSARPKISSPVDLVTMFDRTAQQEKLMDLIKKKEAGKSTSQYCHGKELIKSTKHQIKEDISRVHVSNTPVHKVKIIDDAKLKLEQIKDMLYEKEQARMRLRFTRINSDFLMRWDGPLDSRNTELMKRPLLSAFIAPLRAAIASSTFIQSIQGTLITLTSHSTKALDPIQKQWWDQLATTDQPLNFWGIFNAHLIALWIILKQHTLLVRGDVTVAAGEDDPNAWDEDDIQVKVEQL